jgi:hypothetical protein
MNHSRLQEIYAQALRGNQQQKQLRDMFFASFQIPYSIEGKSGIIQLPP